jgi:hypothetical protein
VTLDAQLICPGSVGKELSRHKTTAVFADAAFGIGAVATVAGVVLLATNGNRAVGESSGRLGVDIGPTHVRLTGRF